MKQQSERSKPQRALARALVALAILLAVTIQAGPRAARAYVQLPRITASEAIVIDGWNGSVLFAKSPDVPRAPASTVKVMTALVALRLHIPLGRAIYISNVAATYGGSSAGLFAGERMTFWNLLHGMLLPSGNDAAVAVAQGTAGDISHFVQRMNATAAFLHLTHTHYLSPNGFDAWGQVTTARDLADLTRIAMKQSVFARVARTRYWTARSVDGRYVHRWENRNRLLWLSKDIDGVKTGTTAYAGACLVSSAHDHGRWVIEVNLGSSAGARFSDGSFLLRYGLSVDQNAPTAD